ncbi:RNA polymerase sigma-70 factor (ECF subfamily) [Rhodopirellula rubra]|uniref:RNA polymerase sigma-70 factor (ECF subfamily) n=1 Tax=Aporhodopirellula rubra TaxID=980271 RepID=A0A7W5E5B4_9BACT|nr:sigma-70 family RNA polymerase sigma factor [Aporhodopirellula rubra]MBB3210485.1 RNA polymerase sigma-70 factor (ECF subfamily) [Aporhodopirellula rubra]
MNNGGKDDPCEFDCDDDRLLDAAREGSHSAFKRLVQCNQDQLFASMHRYLGSHADAEESVQEAFVRAFSRLETFNHESKFSTWLYRIAFNAANSQKRKHRPRVSLDESRHRDGTEVVDTREGSCGDKMLRDEEIELIHAALDGLSDDHRAILVLREFHDLAYEEIAKVLEITVGTVRSRLSRARGELRNAIGILRTQVRSHSDRATAPHGT